MTPQEKAKELICANCSWRVVCEEEKDTCNDFDKVMQMHEWTKKELLKNATDIIINRDFLADIKQYIHEKYLDYKVGKKVKLVLIKEEEL